MKDSDLRLKKEKIVLDLFEENYKIYIFLIIYLLYQQLKIILIINFKY
jgi:hypothetical protein